LGQLAIIRTRSSCHK